ncbi:hypothetical protein FA95DRAFT_1562094 [Auriscalpium vulgare]|uniref:Uncharacterized protein n=1 Tax=Auriscalpium vulgare TaxID=40419 RepID=A0ACB8RLT5_9AGAM|nr:hypothetical protein FA95DRAFT_1562094 [Auriscalpium vulgare]
MGMQNCAEAPSWFPIDHLNYHFYLSIGQQAALQPGELRLALLSSTLIPPPSTLHRPSSPPAAFSPCLCLPACSLIALIAHRIRRQASRPRPSSPCSRHRILTRTRTRTSIRRRIRRQRAPRSRATTHSPPQVTHPPRPAIRALPPPLRRSRTRILPPPRHLQPRTRRARRS